MDKHTLVARCMVLTTERSTSRVIRFGGWRYFELEDFLMLLTFVRICIPSPSIDDLLNLWWAGLLHECYCLGQYTVKATFHQYPPNDWHSRHEHGRDRWQNLWEQGDLHNWGVYAYDSVGMQSMHVPSVLQVNVRDNRLLVFSLLTWHKYRSGLQQQRLVKLLIAYVILGWLVTEIFFFGIWCRPFLNYFRVFDDNDRKFPMSITSSSYLLTSASHSRMWDIWKASHHVLRL